MILWALLGAPASPMLLVPLWLLVRTRVPIIYRALLSVCVVVLVLLGACVITFPGMVTLKLVNSLPVRHLRKPTADLSWVLLGCGWLDWGGRRQRCGTAVEEFS